MPMPPLRYSMRVDVADVVTVVEGAGVAMAVVVVVVEGDAAVVMLVTVVVVVVGP